MYYINTDPLLEENSLEGGGGTIPPTVFCCWVGVEALGVVDAGGVEDFCCGAGVAPCVHTLLMSVHVHA